MSTRFYFEFTGSVPVMTKHFHPAWNYVTEWKPANLRPYKGPIGLDVQYGQGSQIGPWTAGNHALDRQYWSPPLSGNQIINGTIAACQLMVREFATGDNTARVYINILLCNQTGGVRANLLSHNQYGPSVEFLSSGMRNKRVFTSGTQSYGSSLVVCERNDFIVVELGYSDAAGATPEAAANWGINSALPDCPIEETTTANRNPFIEFSQEFKFIEQILISDDE